MNIVLVTGALGDGAGGLATAVRSWAEALADSGHSVSLFYLGLEGVFGKPRLPDNASIHVVRVPCFRENLTNFVISPTLYKKIYAFCRHKKIDVIHANGVWLPGMRAAARVANNLDIPFIASPHGHLQPWAIGHRGWKKKIAWWLYARKSLEAANVIQVASNSERDVVEYLLPSATTRIVPNIIKLPAGNEASYHKAGVRTALFLSRLHPSKGVEVLIEAWAKLRPHGWQLLVVGPDEVGFRERLSRRIDTFDIGQSIKLMGAIEFNRRGDYFRAADLFVLPSYSENFAIVVGEAMSASLPVITTRAAPWPELADLGCGWWVDTGIESLLEALNDALQKSPDDLKRMGEIAKSCIESSYSSESALTGLLTAYEQAVKSFKDRTCN